MKQAGEHHRSSFVKNKIAFLFTGLGSQYHEMAHGLYRSEIAFKEALDQCASILIQEHNIDLYPIIWPEDIFCNLIDQAQYALPALYSIEYALCRLWASYGVKPDLVLGHSIGEYVAATVAGIISLEDGLKLVASQGRLVEKLTDKTGMLVVKSDHLKVCELISKRLDLELDVAAINSPSQTVVSGTLQNLDEFVKICKEAQTDTSLLKASHGFHSRHMAPIIDDFRNICQTVRSNKAKMSYISSVTGEVTGENNIDSLYWLRNSLEPVNFTRAMAALENSEINIVIEIGPRPILTRLAHESFINKNSKTLFLSSIRINTDDQQIFYNNLAILKNSGLDIISKEPIEMIEKNVVQPTNPTEQKLQPIVSALLNLSLEQTSIEDDLISLGIDSLTTTRLCSQIREEFGIRLTNKDIFESSTISVLSQRLTSLEHSKLSHDNSIPKLSPQTRPESLPLSFAQERMWVVHQSNADPSTYNMPYAFRLSGQLDYQALKKSFSTIITRHAVLRTRFVEGEHEQNEQNYRQL